ncbi:MAG: hypothetical protein HY422_00510 [Candidatus Komeilibacteria bacterium]|nr:hypothetical protein [Candidatus Komeilibacteria bacterium]
MHDTFQQKLWGLLRIAFGFIFFWAFVDKLFGLGFATTMEKAWLNGGSPTLGFLKLASKGPLAPLYQIIAGTPLVDWLFMLGLLGIGTALLLGIGMRIACYSGAVLVILMYTAVLPPANNPILDEHIIYFFVFLLLGAFNAGDYLGFGVQWKKTGLVKQYPFLA